MSKKHNIFRDLSKLFESTLSNAANITQEAKSSLKHQFEEAIKKLDLVDKDELDVVRKIAQKNRAEINKIKEHLGLTDKDKES